jgi:hypothetical protein
MVQQQRQHQVSLSCLCWCHAFCLVRCAWSFRSRQEGKREEYGRELFFLAFDVVVYEPILVSSAVDKFHVDHSYTVTVMILLWPSSLSISTSPASPTSPSLKVYPQSRLSMISLPSWRAWRVFIWHRHPFARARPTLHARRGKPPFSCCGYAETILLSQNSKKRRSCGV